MKEAVIIPKMGANIDEARLLRWLKQPGDRVEDLEPLFEIETQKGVFEVESELAGTLAEIVHESGTFKENDVIGYLETE